jgi:hypothetical protein
MSKRIPIGESSILLPRGFPDDVSEFDEFRHVIAGERRRVVMPHSRGIGPTHYRNTAVFRSGQQAALGKDVINLFDALKEATILGPVAHHRPMRTCNQVAADLANSL